MGVEEKERSDGIMISAWSAINQSRACVQLVNSLKRFPPSVILASVKLYPVKTFSLSLLRPPRRVFPVLLPRPPDSPLVRRHLPFARPVRSFVLLRPQKFCTAGNAAVADGDEERKKNGRIIRGRVFGPRTFVKSSREQFARRDERGEKKKKKKNPQERREKPKRFGRVPSSGLGTQRHSCGQEPARI